MFSKYEIKKAVGAGFILVLFLSLSNSFLWAQEANTHQGLPPGQGRDLVLGNCTVCHSSAIILQNHMTRESWDETISWMQKEQGMWDLDKKDRKIILDYLARHQGADPKFNQNSKNRKNPMYEFEYYPNPL